MSAIREGLDKRSLPFGVFRGKSLDMVPNSYFENAYSKGWFDNYPWLMDYCEEERKLIWIKRERRTNNGNN